MPIETREYERELGILKYCVNPVVWITLCERVL
jgi:hypothetical protein